MKNWTKKVPSTEGWYWIKYHGKHGLVKCPCAVVELGVGEMVITTARNDFFTEKNRKLAGFEKAVFGPKIPIPAG